MHRNIRSVLLSVSLLVPLIVHANIDTNNSLLTNFDQLVKAVENGDDVKAIIHLDRCQITDPSIQNQLAQYLLGASTRLNFTRYLHYSARIDGQLRDTVTTNMTNAVEQPTPGLFWSIFARLNVYDDNTATLDVDYFDPVSHKSFLVVEWLCDISNGKDTRGLVLIDSF
jgi:hypothetical protein